MNNPTDSNQTKSAVVRSIIADVLSCPMPAADSEISMHHLQNWDSMAHVSIVVAIEAHFGVEATAGLLEAQSLSELVAELDRL